MSSCISGGGGRTYRIDIDIVKSPSTSTRTSHSHSSSPSSTLSESSNSPLAISTRKPRTPRKRPNQIYNEAAALLSTVYPNIFSTRNLKKPSKNTRVFDSFAQEFCELLPHSPYFNAEFLIHQPLPNKSISQIEYKPTNSTDSQLGSPSPPSPAFNSDSPQPVFQFEPKAKNSRVKPCQSPNNDSQLTSWSPCDTYEENFDAESILDEEMEEGIDSIMGNLSMDKDLQEEREDANSNSSCYLDPISPYSWNPMGLGFGGKFDFGFGMNGGVRGALRHVDDGDWWRVPTVDILDISPKLKKVPREKKKKKIERVQELKNSELPKENLSSNATNSNSSPSSSLKAALCLKLNYQEVLNAWSDRGSPFSEDIPGAEPSESDAIARIGQIDLFGENGGLREASVLRYREKRRSRLFSKKIRYEVRKVNADRRPRMKGRFVRRPAPTLNGQEMKRK